MKADGIKGMKIYIKELGRMTKMAAMPICGKKNLENLLLKNHWTDGLGSWFVALGTLVLARLLK